MLSLAGDPAFEKNAAGQYITMPPGGQAFPYPKNTEQRLTDMRVCMWWYVSTVNSHAAVALSATTKASQSRPKSKTRARDVHQSTPSVISASKYYKNLPGRWTHSGLCSRSVVPRAFAVCRAVVMRIGTGPVVGLWHADPRITPPSPPSARHTAARSSEGNNIPWVGRDGLTTGADWHC